METKKGVIFNPAPICGVPGCIKNTSARLTESDGYEDHGRKHRKDLCKQHAIVTVRHFGDKVEVVAVWNDMTMEDFDD